MFGGSTKPVVRLSTRRNGEPWVTRVYRDTSNVGWTLTRREETPLERLDRRIPGTSYRYIRRFERFLSDGTRYWLLDNAPWGCFSPEFDYTWNVSYPPEGGTESVAYKGVHWEPGYTPNSSSLISGQTIARIRDSTKPDLPVIGLYVSAKVTLLDVQPCNNQGFLPPPPDGVGGWILNISITKKSGEGLTQQIDFPGRERPKVHTEGSGDGVDDPPPGACHFGGCGCDCADSSVEGD